MSDNEARTRVVPLAEDRWTNLGEGPAIIGPYAGEILFAAGDIAPADNDVGVLLRFDNPPLSVATGSKLWARACLGNRNTRAVVVPLTPPAAKDFR